MVPVAPQEVLELIVDEVYSANALSTSYDLKPLLVMLRTGRCFGPRCRAYLYREIKLSLENPPLLTLSKSALHFLDLIRSTPRLGELVKRVTYRLHFRSSEHDPVQMVESPAWQGLIDLKQHLVNVDHVSFDFSTSVGLYPETLLTNTRFLRPITIILPSSSFTTLSIAIVILHPLYLLELLSHCPAVTALTLFQIETDSVLNDWPETVPSSPPSMITKLTLLYAEDFIQATPHFSVFKNFFSGVRRLFLMRPDFRHAEFSRGIRELIASMVYLDEIVVSTARDEGFFIPELVHAPSLCVEVEGVSGLCDALLKDTTTARLERLALVIDKYPLEPLRPINSLWSRLASALCHPRLSALKTVCITFNELHVVDETLDVVRRCFHESELGAKVTVRRMPMQGVSSKDMY